LPVGWLTPFCATSAPSRPRWHFVDLDQVDLAAGAPPRRLSLEGHPTIGGDQPAAFEPAEPFAWLS
jgi:hypothetical protein